MLMSVHKDWLDVVTTVSILLGAFSVLVWMDLNYYQIIALVPVMNTCYIARILWVYGYRLSQKKQPG